MLNNLKTITPFKASQLNSQELAFVGDSVYSTFIRSFFVLKGNERTNTLHLSSNNFVKATGQSEHLKNIIDMLTEEESSVVRRAKNYKTNNTAKHASIEDYKNATAFEALIGYLYISGQDDRLNEILQTSIKGEELCN